MKKALGDLLFMTVEEAESEELRNILKASLKDYPNVTQSQREHFRIVYAISKTLERFIESAHSDDIIEMSYGIADDVMRFIAQKRDEREMKERLGKILTKQREEHELKKR